MEQFDFNSINGTSLYKLERSIGEHIKFVGLVNEKGSLPFSIEYWVEIDGIKIPSSIGYARTREDFVKSIETSAIKLFTELIGEIAPLIVSKGQ